jgi:hypothetical protein
LLVVVGEPLEDPMMRPVLAVLLGGALVVAACGDDDDAASNDEYCDVARELAESEEEGFTDERLDRYVELAPDEIADEAELAADAIQERGDEAFDDPEVVDAVEDIEAFELEECGIGREGGTDDGDADDGGSEDTDDGTTDEGDTTDDTVDDGTDADETTTTLVEDPMTTVSTP